MPARNRNGTAMAKRDRFSDDPPMHIAGLHAAYAGGLDPARVVEQVFDSIARVDDPGIFCTATYPIGNFYAKKALNYVSPSTILFVRFFLAGLFILPVAVIVETHSHMISIIVMNWSTLLFTGLILLGVGKIIWYEGLGRLDISKAISLSMTFPIFSLILLIGVFKEALSRYQWIGIAVMVLGIFISVKRSSVDPRLTKYAP